MSVNEKMNAEHSAIENLVFLEWLRGDATQAELVRMSLGQRTVRRYTGVAAPFDGEYVESREEEQRRESGERP